MVPHVQHATRAPEQKLLSSPEMGTAIAQAPRSKEKGKVPPPLSTNSGLMCIPTNQPFITTVESIQNAASGASRWQGKSKQPPYYIRQTAKSSTTIEYGREDAQQIFTDRAILNLWRDVREFSDCDADLLLYIFSAIIRETNGAGSVWIWASHFLDQRGIKPMMKRERGRTRRAGHRTEDFATIDQAIYRLSGLWINIEEIIQTGNKGKKRVYRHKGRVLVVVEIWSQQTLSAEEETAERLPIAWKIRAGDWLVEYLKAPRYVAFLYQKSLQYDPVRERWEKRLSRYFLFFLRINAKHGAATLVREVGELLQANSLPLDRRNPYKTRHHFERSMDRLVTDGHIDAWEYEPDSQSQLPLKKWLGYWLTWRIRIFARTRGSLPG